MSCAVITEIRLNDQLLLQPPNPQLTFLTLPRKTLTQASSSLESFLNNSQQSPILFLDLGDLLLNIQLKEDPIPSKSVISNSISSFFSGTNLNFSGPTDSDYLAEINNQANYIEEFCSVLNNFSSLDSVNTVKNLIKLSNDLEDILENLRKKAKNVAGRLKDKMKKGEKEGMMNKIKELNEEIAELNTQLVLAKDEYTRNGIQMEICRRSSRISELRSQNILMVSESRQKLYCNSISARQGPVHPRTRSFISIPKVPVPISPMQEFRTCEFLPILNDLDEFLSVTQTLQEILSDFSGVSL